MKSDFMNEWSDILLSFSTQFVHCWITSSKYDTETVIDGYDGFDGLDGLDGFDGFDGYEWNKIQYLEGIY